MCWGQKGLLVTFQGIWFSCKTRQKQSGCSYSTRWKGTTWPLIPGLCTGPGSTCHAQYEHSKDPEKVRAGKSPERELKGVQMLNGGRSSQCLIPIHSPAASQLSRATSLKQQDHKHISPVNSEVAFTRLPVWLQLRLGSTILINFHFRDTLWADEIFPVA